MAIKVHFREMRRQDLHQVVEMEYALFDDAWSEDEFVDVCRKRNTICTVAELSNSGIVGYSVYQCFRDRMEIVNLGVDPLYQRRGIGTLLVSRIVSRLSAGRGVVTVSLFERDVYAQLFFRSLGFVAVETLPNSDARFDGSDYRFELALFGFGKSLGLGGVNHEH